MPATTTETLSLVNRTVTVAPLVLLSAADHYGRVKQARSKRVLGVLLGENNPASKTVSVTNCFAVPFEEDDRDPSVWFIDHNYIESMNEMFKKVNAREKLIGWYHTGPKLRASDLEINELFKRYTPNPLLVIIDVQPKEVGVPTDAYISIEEIKDDGSSTGRTFVHIPSEIRAEEAEEIGVEHLLRDIRDVAVGTLSTRMTSQLQSLQGLHLRLRDIGVYLDKVAKGELPVNHAILGNLQDMFNLLPGLSSMAATPPQRQVPGGGHLTNGTSMEIDVPHDLQRQGQPSASPGGNSELARAMAVKTNDQLMSIYLSSLIRAITAFHDLIENKIENRRQQEERDHAQQEEKEKRDKEDRERKDRDKAEKADGEVNGAGDKMDIDGDAKKPNDKSKEGGGKK